MARMMEMQIHEDFTRLPLEELESRTAYPQQLAEQLYMYSGNTEEVCFLADSCILSDVLDWFGSEIRIEPAMRPNLLRITVQVHPTAMQHWALQYGKYVTVLSPESLRMELAEIAAKLSKRYKEELPENDEIVKDEKETVSSEKEEQKADSTIANNSKENNLEIIEDFLRHSGAFLTENLTRM